MAKGLERLSFAPTPSTDATQPLEVVPEDLSAEIAEELE